MRQAGLSTVSTGTCTRRCTAIHAAVPASRHYCCAIGTARRQMHADGTRLGAAAAPHEDHRSVWQPPRRFAAVAVLMNAIVTRKTKKCIYVLNCRDLTQKAHN